MMSLGSRVEIIESVLREEIVDSGRTLTKPQVNLIANRILDLLDKLAEEVTVNHVERPPFELFERTASMILFEELAGQIMINEIKDGVKSLTVDLIANYEVRINSPERKEPMVMKLPIHTTVNIDTDGNAKVKEVE